MDFRFAFIGLLSLMAVSCSVKEIDRRDISVPDSDGVFHVTIGEQPGTKVYLGEDLHVLWNADDHISIFNRKTLNREYRFDGKDGDDSGSVSPLGDDGDGSTLRQVFAVYPYQASTGISTSGTITYTLPAEQVYRKDSFGAGANVMVSAADSDNLLFKNACGYLSFKFFGEDLSGKVYSVSSVTLKSNKGELLSGPCTITVSGGIPALTMSEGGSDQLTLTCESPVDLGPTASSAAQFIFVLPPVTLAEGFTVTVTTSDGESFEMSSTKQRVIGRSAITRMKVVGLETEPDPDAWESAADAVRNMGVGWNLGHSLDGNSFEADNMWLETRTDCSVAAYETALGQPLTTRDLIKMFKDAGFGAIRIPVTWFPHMGNFQETVRDGKWNKDEWEGAEIDPAWMARVKEIVDYVIEEGMYCILNVHHDTGVYTTSWLKADMGVYEATHERYCALWTQIAEEFKSYGPKLVFEAFNEMIDCKENWNGASVDANEAINSFNADFVRTVRATGGYNACRNLALGTYAARPVSSTMESFIVPEDPASNHLMAEFHSYAPVAFAQGGNQYFGELGEYEVRDVMDFIWGFRDKYGLPCIIGEYCTFEKRAESELAKQAACYVKFSTQYGFACFYWMVLSDGEDRSVPQWSMPLLKDAIINTYLEYKN